MCPQQCENCKDVYNTKNDLDSGLQCFCCLMNLCPTCVPKDVIYPGRLLPICIPCEKKFGHQNWSEKTQYERTEREEVAEEESTEEQGDDKESEEERRKKEEEEERKKKRIEEKRDKVCYHKKGIDANTDGRENNVCINTRICVSNS